MVTTIALIWLACGLFMCAVFRSGYYDLAPGPGAYLFALVFGPFLLVAWAVT